jgi:anaerobic selenocysteine-containing dehydrogenase
MAMGGNFLSATPDTKYTAEALQTCDLTVQVSTKLNRSHLITGKEALILPCLSRSDQDLLNNEPQFISCENSMGVIQKSQGSLKPISNQLKSEPTIVIELALKLFGNDGPVNWSKYLQHYDYIRDDIEKAIPGFTDYNKRVRELGGFYLPNSSREGKFNELSTQKAHFVIGTLNNIHLNENELMMMTIRSHDQFNTTIYGLDDRYRGVFNERRVVFMNPEDCLRLGFKVGDLVDLLNFDDGIERVARKFVVVEFNIPKSCTATYFPEANVLVPIKSVAAKSNTPTSKMVIIQLRKHQDGL